LVKRTFIRAHHRNRQARQIATASKWQVGLEHAGIGFIRYGARTNGKHHRVIWIGIRQGLRIADTEVIQVDAATSEFHTKRGRAGIEGHGSEFDFRE